MNWQKIKYSDLNGRQQETYNFQKVAGRLADYGYCCMLLNDDWQGADFLAVHINGNDILKVQLKGRCEIHKKYIGKNLFVAFFDDEDCFIFPHDETVKKIFSEKPKTAKSGSWLTKGKYTWNHPPEWLRVLLKDDKI